MNRTNRRAAKATAHKKVVPIGKTKNGANGAAKRKADELPVGARVEADSSDQETIASTFAEVQKLQSLHSSERARFLAVEMTILGKLAEAQKSHQAVLGAVGKKYGVDFANAAKGWTYYNETGIYERKA